MFWMSRKNFPFAARVCVCVFAGSRLSFFCMHASVLGRQVVWGRKSCLGCLTRISVEQPITLLKTHTLLCTSPPLVTTRLRHDRSPPRTCAFVCENVCDLQMKICGAFMTGRSDAARGATLPFVPRGGEAGHHVFRGKAARQCQARSGGGSQEGGTGRRGQRKRNGRQQ